MRKLIFIVITLLLIGLAFYGASNINAQTSGNNQQTLIQRIAERFNLNTGDVQKVADDYQSEKMKTRQAEMRNRFEQRLTEEVNSGKISEAQKQAILKKHDELQVRRDQERIEMQAWAAQNGLDDTGMGFGFGMFKFGRGGHYWK